MEKHPLKGIIDNKPVYIVGGWLRDALLGRASRDLDLGVAGDPVLLSKKIARAFKGTLVTLDEENLVYRVVLKNDRVFDYLDIAKLKGPDILSDLKRRDFTINATALPLDKNGKIDLSKIIDPLGGKNDLKKRVVRMTSANAFKEDPLRLLRAFRFAGEIGLRIEPATRARIKSDAGLITRVAGERIREELFRILRLPCSSVWVRELERSGLLEAIIPEVTAMKRSARRFYFHPLGLWQHVLESLISFEDILSRLDEYFPEHAAKIREHLGEKLSPGITRENLLKIVCLLHDVGKPSTAKRVENKMRFLGHEEKGGETASEILRRLKLTTKEIRMARKLIESHMRPVSLSQASALTPRASFRLFRDMGAEAPDLLLLALSDWHSYRRLKTSRPVGLKKQEATLRELMRRFFAGKEKHAAPHLVDGNAMMKAFDLKPGPIIGELLQITHEAQALGKIKTRQEALALAGKRLTPLKKKYRIT